PLLARWIPFVYGAFRMDPRLFIAMLAYVAYSVVVYMTLGRTLPERAAMFTTWADVLFGVAIGTMTEGVTGPSYPFFAFAVVTSGLRGGLRQAMTVTTASLVLYLGLIMISGHARADLYIMRPVY